MLLSNYAFHIPWCFTKVANVNFSRVVTLLDHYTELYSYWLA
jgi:hypothetical protein